jgi:uncharacterized protein
METRVIQSKNSYWGRMEKGEEIMECIKNFCREKGIKNGKVSAIGACDQVILGIFKPEKGIYIKKEFCGDYEIISLTGNISIKENEAFAHIHVSLGDENFHLIGGHLFQAKVSVTCEFFIEEFNSDIERKYDKETGLMLLDMN